MRMLHGQARQQLTDPLELHFMHLLMAVESISARSAHLLMQLVQSKGHT